MNGKSVFSVIVLLFLAWLASASLYTIKESQRGVLTQFGRIIRADLRPGLGFKLPIFHEVVRYDGRILLMDMRPEEYITKEKKRLIVDSYAMWRIRNVEKFFTSTRGEVGRAQRLLAPIINGRLRNKFGERTVYEVISGEREQVMLKLTKQVDAIAQAEYGIEVVDVRVKQIDLPTKVTESVYSRMRAEREREAREYRSKGKEIAEGVRADADAQARISVAKARRDSETLRGEGDATAARIYAEAFSQEPQFYEYYRSLLAYKNTFSSKSDLIIISPDSDFFNYLKSPILEKKP
ncbi:MAG: protease modulator HflC [Gammaproteobacteria bacterium]